MSSTLSSSHFLQEMAYPPYCIQPLKSWGMIAIGGGGGTAKTGVGNAVDLKWIYLNQSSDPTNNKCSIQNVNSFTQHDSVMRMVSLRKQQQEFLILALNRQLKVIMLKASQRELDGGLGFNISPPPTGNSQDSANNVPIVPAQRSVRRRHNSSTSTATEPVNVQHRPSIILHRNGQATVEAIGNEILNAQSPTNRTGSFSFPPVMTSSTTTTTTTASILNNIYTVPIKDEEYVNALAICPATQSKLFVGASDGSLTIYDIIWPASTAADRLIQLNLVTSFTAHSKEIDDLAVDPLGTWLISVSRDHHVQIRQCSPPFDKHGELDLNQFGTNKNSKPSYRIRHVRFGIVPRKSSSNATSFLYTSLIPQIINDKLTSYIVQWTENKQHQFVVRQRRAVTLNDRISAIAVSNCGQYVSVGDSGGCVRIYDSERLKLIYEHRAHSIFVTDLTFILREENYLYETSVLSISADKNLYVHNVHPPQTNLFSVSFLIVIGLLFLFLLLSQIRFRFH